MPSSKAIVANNIVALIMGWVLFLSILHVLIHLMFTTTL